MRNVVEFPDVVGLHRRPADCPIVSAEPSGVSCTTHQPLPMISHAVEVVALFERPRTIQSLSLTGWPQQHLHVLSVPGRPHAAVVGAPGALGPAIHVRPGEQHAGKEEEEEEEERSPLYRM